MGISGYVNSIQYNKAKNDANHFINTKNATQYIQFAFNIIGALL